MGESVPKSPSPPTPLLTPEFNRRAVAETYATACDLRGPIRDANIFTPPDEFTPPPFRRQSSAIALYSPYMDDEAKLIARKMIGSVPDYVMDLFYQQGGVFIFTSRSLVEALPNYADYIDEKGQRPYHNYYVGLYFGDEKRIMVTFNLARIVEDRNGGYQILDYEPLNGKFRVFHHELGHYIDDALGELGTGEPSKKFTDSQNFLKALEADLVEIARAGHSKALLKYLDYFLPEEYKGVKLFGRKGHWPAIRGEVFAELWAEIQGHGVYELNKYFPRTYELIRQVDRELRLLRAANGRDCDRGPMFKPGILWFAEKKASPVLTPKPA